MKITASVLKLTVKLGDATLDLTIEELDNCIDDTDADELIEKWKQERPHLFGEE